MATRDINSSTFASTTAKRDMSNVAKESVSALVGSVGQAPSFGAVAQPASLVFSPLSEGSDILTLSVEVIT